MRALPPFLLSGTLALTVLLVGCAPTPPSRPLVAPFFATDYYLPPGQSSDSLLHAAVREGVLTLTTRLSTTSTWLAADSTVQRFLSDYANTEAYGPLAQISARAFLRHRLLADTTAMTEEKARVLLRYLALMVDQGSYDYALMQRSVDSLYVLADDSLSRTWKRRLEALQRTAAETPPPTPRPLPPPAPPGG